MNTKLLLTLTAALALGSTSLFAGPGPRDPAPRSNTVRTWSAPVATMKCDTMTIKAGGKDAGTRVVACKDFAKVRPADCRLACS
jgi:hypothetical protein